VIARAAWYPTVDVAAVREATRSGRASLFSIAGEPLVLWCTGDGTPVALADRCAHQEAELATGICRGDVLICKHHGWTHDPDGTARPPGGRNWKAPPGGWPTTPSYRVVEHLGYLWAALEAPDGPPPGDGMSDGGCHVSTRRFDLPPETLLDVVCSRVDADLATIDGRMLKEPDGKFCVTYRPDGQSHPSLIVAVTPLESKASQLYCFVSETAAAAVEPILERAIAAVACEVK